MHVSATPAAASAPTDHAVASLAERVQSFLERVRRETGVPGLAAAFSIRGRRVSISAGARSTRTAEPLRNDARFHLGCTTKLLLAAVALELAQERQGLDLDAPLAEYLTELRGTPHGEGVRLSHLLSHTSGYRGTNIFDPGTRALRWEGLVEHLRRAPRLFAPGAVFSYEHTESVLLGRIVERITARSSLGLIRERLFDPLGIVPGRLGDFERDRRSAGRHELDARAGRFLAIEGGAELAELWHAAFSTYTLSLDDLVRVGEGLIAGSAGPDCDSPMPIGAGAAGTPPLREETRRRLVRAVVRLPPTIGGAVRESLPVAFGLGAAELPGGVYGNNGLTQGQCLALRFDPAAGVVAAAALNATLPPLRDFILSTVLAEIVRATQGVDAGRPEAHRRPPGPSADVPLAELTGRYLGPGSAVLCASLADERLVLELDGNGTRASPIGELAIDDEQRLVLQSPIPQLSLGIFREPEHGVPGIMLGLNAYARVTSRG
jgi:CubicO group peptidase (beta-lactamase class C family)